MSIHVRQYERAIKRRQINYLIVKDFRFPSKRQPVILSQMSFVITPDLEQENVDNPMIMFP